MVRTRYLLINILILLLFCSKAFAQSGAGVFVIPSGDCTLISAPVTNATFCLTPGPPPLLSVWNGSVYVPSGSGPSITMANASAPGTTVNKLAKVTGSTSLKAIVTSPGDLTSIGIVTSGAGTTGNASIKNIGLADCVFDNSPFQGDFVGISNSINGDCTDLGGAADQGGVVGTAAVSGAGPGTYGVILQIGTGWAPACGGTVVLSSGDGTFTNSCVLTTSFCSCHDTTDNSNACYAANAGAGSVELSGNASDTINVSCQKL